MKTREEIYRYSERGHEISRHKRRGSRGQEEMETADWLSGLLRETK